MSDNSKPLMYSTFIPARGTVDIYVYTFDSKDPGALVVEDPDLLIDGPTRWSRPVVGLIDRYYHGDDVRRRGLPYQPVIVDEVGVLFAVDDYLEELMGGLHWDHSTAIYMPHVDGPVSDAPHIRRGDGQALYTNVHAPNE
jgi:hypothetical protein